MCGSTSSSLSLSDLLLLGLCQCVVAGPGFGVAQPAHEGIATPTSTMPSGSRPPAPLPNQENGRDPHIARPFPVEKGWHPTGPVESTAQEGRKDRGDQSGHDGTARSADAKNVMAASHSGTPVMAGNDPLVIAWFALAASTPPKPTACRTRTSRSFVRTVATRRHRRHLRAAHCSDGPSRRRPLQVVYQPGHPADEHKDGNGQCAGTTGSVVRRVGGGMSTPTRRCSASAAGRAVGRRERPGRDSPMRTRYRPGGARAAPRRAPRQRQPPRRPRVRARKGQWNWSSMTPPASPPTEKNVA